MKRNHMRTVPPPDMPAISLSRKLFSLEVVADKLSAAVWSWGYCRAVTPHGWPWIVDAHRGDGRRFIVESDELLAAFLELESTLP
jgi:hypothetical protein